ncbi:Aldo/keto reductase [Schizopora paradoxa]|uniref:Aldo/keto reductase n=1 Tax=Schizopora paradoxa TaxID=27342 RepID=A0A0H2RXM3_9AGAM|nr:Aldo/keto reductase [Schizopora paradoxa]
MNSVSTKRLPRIIYGTAWQENSTTDLVVSAVLQGFQAIDTACQPKHYRSNLVGEALTCLYEKHGFKREDLWLQTKFTSIRGQDSTKPLPYDPQKPVREQVLQSFAKSLENLHTDYLDSYVLHGPLETVERTLEAWKAMGSLQDEGKVHLIGVSNTYEVGLLKTLEQERSVQVVQNRWHDGNGWDKEVVKYCKEHGIMYQPFWTLTGSPRLVKSKQVQSLAEEHKCTPEQMVYRIAQINGVVPLAGSKDESHMRDGVKTEEIDLSKTIKQTELDEVIQVLFR